MLLNNRVLILSLGLIFSIFCNAQKKVDLNPVKEVSKVTLKGKYEHKYYALSSKSSTIYKVNGPGVISLNVRVRVEEGLKSEPFKIKVIKNNKHIDIYEVPALTVGNLKFKSQKLPGAPTKYYRLDIPVEPGKNTYKIYKYQPEPRVYVKAYYTPFSKPQWKDLKSKKVLASSNIQFTKSGRVSNYYELNRKTNQFLFNFNGSDYLRIIVRPKFSYSMLDEILVKLKLTNLNTGEEKIYRINSKRTSSAIFVNDKKNAVGVSSTLYLEMKPEDVGSTFKLELISGCKKAAVKVSENVKGIKR
ncbi:hypothetical protein [Luteibaculum oceani]|uniref:Uncharacterized protein n=1 Tax=Luteibaculum oceani TaxID=1294296 RepID=A0A5C6UYS6_9FLAO|nr:hypothetical protein [Luteibaculum oceani]TXC76118.1 hypothetical protein FRX97_11440 [Luteibaculum oceani]